jgi:hypothetical protein
MARSKSKESPVTAPQQQLQEVIASLARSGASQYFLEIRRRAPGVPGQDKLWQRWKVGLPAEDVEDIRDYCHSVGGDSYEYKVWVKDGSGNPVKGPDGQVLGPYIIPAVSAPPPAIAGTPNVPEDPDLAERAKELKRKRAELELQRAEAQLERERKRYEKMLAGEEDEDEKEKDELVFNPVLGGYFPKNSPMAYGGMPFSLSARTDAFVEITKALAPVVTAILTTKKEDKLTTADLVKLLLERGKDNGWSPKDMVGFIAPLMAEVTKITGDVNKIAMERMADSDAFWKEKLIEAAKLGGASEDEIDRWRKIMGLATETLKDATQLFFRPAPQGSAPNVAEKPKPAALPQAGPAAAAAAAAAAANPAEQAKKVARERIEAFLVAHEQEMLVGSDPVAVADKLYELYLLLPLPLRAKIESSETAAIYEALREHSAEIVDRILAAVAADATGNFRKFCEDFWAAIKSPEEEEEEEEEDEEEGGTEEERDEKEGAEGVRSPAAE